MNKSHINSKLLSLNYKAKFRYYSQVKKINIDHFLGYNKIVVLSPHMDDEIIGIGSILLDLIEYRNVNIYYFVGTDEKECKTFKKRKKEACKVLQSSNVKKYFFNLVDCKLNEYNIEEIVEEIITKNKPDIIFYTAFTLNNHVDHNTIALTCQNLKNKFPKIDFYGYQIEQPIEYSYKYKVRNFKNKISELKKYRSQLKKVDYINFLSKTSFEGENCYEYLGKL